MPVCVCIPFSLGYCPGPDNMFRMASLFFGSYSSADDPGIGNPGNAGTGTYGGGGSQYPTGFGYGGFGIGEIPQNYSATGNPRGPQKITGAIYAGEGRLERCSVSGAMFPASRMTSVDGRRVGDLFKPRANKPRGWPN